MDTNKIKKGLGRGLSSLIGETKTEVNINKLSISNLVSNKFQPRKIFDEENLQDLTNSIKKRGIIQPIIVRKSSDDSSKYEIIAGERRWLAAQKAGLHDVPVVITDVDDLKSLEFAIIENVQRNDLNALEEARGYQRLIDEFSYDQEKVAQFIGKSRSHITNFLRLLTLPNGVLKLIETKKITPGHAKILVGLDNSEFVANKIVEKNLSVRQAENFVKIFKIKKKSYKTKIKSADLQLEYLNFVKFLNDKYNFNISNENIIFTKANAKLLADSWLYAKERSRSLSVLEDSLVTNPNDLKLAKQYVDIAFSAFQWADVVKGIDRIKKLNIEDDGKYKLMQGIAYFELNQFANAKSAFASVSKSDKYKDSGSAWLEYIEALKG